MRFNYMYKLAAFLLLVVFFTAESGSAAAYKAWADKPAEDGQVYDMERFLKADGKVLRNRFGQGDVVTLKGTNIGGWHVMESWMCPVDSVDQITTIKVLTERFGKEAAEDLLKIYEDNWLTEKDFDYMSELNFNVLRIPISYLNLLDEDGLLRSDTLARLDWAVEECAKRGIYVILDLHAAPGSQSGRDHSGDTSGSILYKDAASQEICISLWVQLAEHYKGNPNIAGYDLLNEPEGDEQERIGWGPVQLPFYDRLYRAVREVDADHLIIIEAIWNATDMPDPSVYGWENVMYQYHFYGWDGIDDVQKQRAFINSKITLDKKTNFNVPVLIGEFTLFEKLQSWEHALSIYEELGWSWTTWTYKTVEMGSWGIFNSKKTTTPVVRITTDSYEVIADKWSKVSTELSFSKNTYLFDLLRVSADKEAAKNDIRRWFRSTEIETKLYSSKKSEKYRVGGDAAAELVSMAEISVTATEEKVIKLTTTDNSFTGPLLRNVCISPTIRDSVDTTGMDYCLIELNVRQTTKGLFVSFVDKDGEVWSRGISNHTPAVNGKWEKLMIDISDMDIDRSSICEIRIGAQEIGTYYIGNVYFAQSYSDPLPMEREEQMNNSMGVKGTLTDWSKEDRFSLQSIITVVSICIAIAAVIYFIIKKKNVSSK